MRTGTKIIYLASASPRRHEILKRMKVRFRVVKSTYHEEHHSHLHPRVLVLRHAAGKARQAIVPVTGQFVLGADTLVYCRGKILGKPKTGKEAFDMLSLISGKQHEVYTGVALWDRKTGKIKKAVSRTRVFVKTLSEKEIRLYIQKVNSLDKAGAYAIQMKPGIVKKIEGSYSNVVGLPEEVVRKLLKLVIPAHFRSRTSSSA